MTTTRTPNYYRRALWISVALVWLGIVGLAVHWWPAKAPVISRVELERALHVELVTVTATLDDEDGQRVAGPVTLKGWWLEKEGKVPVNLTLSPGTYYISIACRVGIR